MMKNHCDRDIYDHSFRPLHLKLYSNLLHSNAFIVSNHVYRCVKEYKLLPGHLKPNFISTDVGLKARVIRSVFHVYKPLAEKHQQIISYPEHPDKVKHQICETFWYRQLISSKRNINVWMFYFKLLPYEHYVKKKPNIFKLTNLISYNPDEHSTILRVTSPSLIQFHNICGLYLTGVSFNVSRDMKHQKLKLTFHDYNFTGKYNENEGTCIFIEPVLDLQILKWWNPEYPHPFDK